MQSDDCWERENLMKMSWEKEGKGSELVCSQGGERKRLRKREEGKEGREERPGLKKTSQGEGGLEREGKGREIGIELEALQLYGI